MYESKSVLLFRHAKSDWSSSYTFDKERELASRGIKAAKKMGRFISACDQIPDKLISSTATRAMLTVQLASEHGHWDRQINYDDRLYDTSCGQMISLINTLDDKMNSIMLVGHEPTWSQLTSILINGGYIRFPTAAICRIDFFVNTWRKVEPGTGQLHWFVIPKLLSYP